MSEAYSSSASEKSILPHAALNGKVFPRIKAYEPERMEKKMNINFFERLNEIAAKLFHGCYIHETLTDCESVIEFYAYQILAGVKYNREEHSTPGIIGWNFKPAGTFGEDHVYDSLEWETGSGRLLLQAGRVDQFTQAIAYGVFSPAGQVCAITEIWSGLATTNVKIICVNYDVDLIVGRPDRLSLLDRIGVFNYPNQDEKMVELVKLYREESEKAAELLRARQQEEMSEGPIEESGPDELVQP